MKGRSVLLDHVAGRRVAVLVVDGRLEDVLVDPAPGLPPGPGAIAHAVVDRPVKGMGGLFVRLPDGEMGYLRGETGLAPGRSVRVQVTGWPEPGKAISVTQRLLFKSRLAIVTPGAPGLNVSRMIKDEGRRGHLRILAEEAMEGSAMGLILRSEAARAEEDEISEDIAEMRALAEAILSDQEPGPTWLTEAPDAHHLAWREWGAPDEVDTSSGCLAARGLLEEIAALGGAAVDLPGGGFMAVEPTRALVAVDVNTGSDASPAAAIKANFAALKDLPRALRLRGLGGQVVVDLAPLPKRERPRAEQVLKSALKGDPVETSFVGWTPLGHMELTRKRERLPLDAALLEAVG